MLDRFVGLDATRVVLDDGAHLRTAAELGDRVTRLGRWLEATVGPGGHFAVVAGNHVEFVELTLAAMVSGTWITAVNWHLHPDEAAYVLGDSGAGVVVTDDRHGSLADAAVGLLDAAPSVVRVGSDLDALAAAASDEPFAPDAAPGGTMLYTSGTTGRPKGVRRATRPTVAAHLEGLAAQGRLLGLDGNGAHLVTGPLYHAAPLGFAVMDMLNGASLHSMPRWDEAAFLAAVDRHDIAHTHLVPTMFVRLLRLDDDLRAGFDPSPLRLVLHGAAPIAPGVKQAMIDWWGPVLVEYWGGSEGGVVTLVDSEAWLAHRGTVGRAIGGHEVFAGDAHGTPLPPDTTGLLWARHPSAEVVFAYHQRPEATDEAHAGPGVYTLGDIGRVDADGWVYLSDRASHMIISGGVNIYPAEIEQVLIEHPAVGDVAVLGLPDPEWGEQVVAVIEPTPLGQASAELAADLRRFAESRLARFKVPRRFETVEALPREPNGKLYVQRLRAQLTEG